MNSPYLKSSTGRLMLGAAAVFLLSFAAYAVASSLYAIAIGMPIGITLAFVSVGLGMDEYTKETLFACTVLPPVLWGAYIAYAHLEGAATWGYLAGLLGVICLGNAAMGGGGEEKASA